MAPFKDREQAFNERRRLLITDKMRSNVRYCDTCMVYHVVIETNDRRPRINPIWVKVVELVAQGYTEDEVVATLAIKKHAARWAIREASRRLYALSTANLVAICIAHGIIDPKKFVAPIKEGHRDYSPPAPRRKRNLERRAPR